MPRVDRHACPTVQAHDARAVMASGRLALNPLGGAAGTVYAVEVDGRPVGAVVHAADGWVAARRGWQDHQPRTRRRVAVRRLLMSHPRGTFDRTPTGRDTDD